MLSLDRLRFRIRRALWGARHAIRVTFWPRAEIARYEGYAEAAYDAMYYAERYGVRECYDDAVSNLNTAMAIAKKHGLQDEAERLKARREHIYNVYTHQFRW